MVARADGVVMKIEVTCSYCGGLTRKESSVVNRARANGFGLYCSLTHAGLSKRKGKTQDQKRKEKQAYDAAYRAKNRAILKAKKAAYHRKTYDPTKARIERKARATRHAEYCRRPEYKRWKSRYDLNYRARAFGQFSESYLILSELEREISERMSRYEIYAANGTLNKRQKRKREYEGLNGSEFEAGPLGNPECHQRGQNAGQSR